MVTINYDFDKILLHCWFKSISNCKDIFEDGFEFFEYIISMTENYIVNLS